MTILNFGEMIFLNRKCNTSWLINYERIFHCLIVWWWCHCITAPNNFSCICESSVTTFINFFLFQLYCPQWLFLKINIRLERILMLYLWTWCHLLKHFLFLIFFNGKIYLFHLIIFGYHNPELICFFRKMMIFKIEVLITDIW